MATTWRDTKVSGNKIKSLDYNDLRNYLINHAAEHEAGGEQELTQLHSHANKTILDAIEEAFTTTLKNKLDGIEDAATIDQTAGEIRDLLAGLTGADRLAFDALKETATYKYFTATLLTKLNGIAEDANNYSLPTATDLVKGGIKIGDRLSIVGEVLSAIVQSDNNLTNTLKTAYDDAVTKAHTQNTDQKLDDGGINEVTAANAKDAVSKKHTQNTDTHLGTVDQDISLNTHKLTGLSVPSSNGESIRATTKITEVNLEDAIDKKHSNASDHTQNTDTALGAQAENLNMNTHKIISVVDPTAEQDAATKKYVDDHILNTYIYGVSWNESTDIYARTGWTVGQSNGVSLSDWLLPIQAKMKRCVVNDAGEVQYYLDAADSTLKENGDASDLTGADGQVMVEIPKFWYKHSYVGTTHTWEISNYPFTGFSIHPAFLSGATELDFIYVGAYEAVLYDFSASAYIDYATGATITPTEDIMSSVTAKKPVTNHTRANFRIMANRRGTGWTGALYDILSAIQILYLTEYASFNSQSVIGAGIAHVTDWAAYNNYYPIAPTGNSNSIGNMTGNTAGSASCATEATKYMSYRGIENWYGHVWKWLDGINTNNNRSYICNVIANLADDTSSNYTDIGINNVASNGYQATLLNIARGFLPASIGATSATKITDYYWQALGWRVALSGGSAANGLHDGGFCLYLALGSSYSTSNFGGRLCFRK